jgi:hypothetical protein
MSARSASFALFVVAVSLPGCGGAKAPKSAAPAAGEADPAFKQVGKENGAAGQGGQPAGVDPKAVKAAGTPAERKIVYRATLDLIVTNLDDVVPQVERLIAEQKGYVARSEVRGDTGSRRTATFTLRVPSDALPAVRERLRGLGTPERDANDSEDATEEYVDVQARIKNLKEQEDKLNELLKEKRKEEKLEDIIKVSDRIAEVRASVERVQGRLNYLANVTPLATVTLTLREIKNYQPPTAPTFRNRAAGAFEASWDAVVWFAEEVALFAVRLTPWLPIVVPAVVALAWAVRRLLRERREPRAESPAEAPPPDGPEG